MDLAKELMNSPVAVGILQKFIISFVTTKLKDLDHVVLNENMDKVAHGAALILSSLSGFMMLFLDHKASNFDPTPLIQYVLTVYSANVAAHEVGKLVKPKAKDSASS